MIKFDTLLRDEGLDPAHVKLVRHQEDRDKGRPSLYQVWRAVPAHFELYQRIQSSLRFAGAKLLASFIATPLGETLFVGIYTVDSVSRAPKRLIDPVTGKNVGGYHYYSLSLSPHLNDYRDRLIIDWGRGYRAWVQNAGSNEKKVVEIRRTAAEPPFPGFLNFRERLSHLAGVPQAWRQALSAVSGVYLLTCPQTGKQYVGSAGGDTGFWGRWEDYAASGHGGNKRMLGLPAADYWVSILEVASSSVGLVELVTLESRWKEKLGSRAFGLNAN